MKITVLGAAGVLGSCSVFNLIVQKLADEIIMVDPWESMLKSHWLDLGTMATVYDITVRMGGYEGMAGSDIVIDTASAPAGSIKSRSELLPSNLPIIQEHAGMIGRYCPDAIVITETNPVDPLNYAMFLLSKHRDRLKILGYSMNDSVRLRMWAAEELGVKAGRVEGTVIGEHGHSQVMLFSTVRLEGKPVHFELKTRQKIRAMPPKMLHAFESLIPKRTAGWTTAMGIADTVRAIARDTREVIPTNVVLTGEYGVCNMSMTVPAAIGRSGMESIVELPLTDEELEGVKNTVATLDPHMRLVEQTLDAGM
jgi:malate/lactate dehydrogenase